MSMLHKPVLVLNKAWMAVNILTAQDGFAKVFSGGAMLVDHEDWQTHSFELWCELPVKEKHAVISTTSGPIRVPEIILLTAYDKVPSCNVKLTRKNLLIRDGHRCAYTGIPLTMRTATIDHVEPRSQGGKNDWPNVVICSVEANRHKADRTPEEAGMTLRRDPFVPRWSALFRACISETPVSWDKFLKPISRKTQSWDKFLKPKPKSQHDTKNTKKRIGVKKVS